MKFCKDCKHYDSGLCMSHPEQNMVDGGPLIRIGIGTRMDETLCGRDAKWFEPKDDPRLRPK